MWVPLFSTAAAIFSFSEELGDKVEEEKIEEVGVKVEEEENDSLVSILGSACRSSSTAGPLPLVPSSSLRVATPSPDFPTADARGWSRPVTYSLLLALGMPPILNIGPRDSAVHIGSSALQMS